MLRRCGFLFQQQNGAAAGAAAVAVLTGECSLSVYPDGVGLITLNRPSRKNALGCKILDELGQSIKICAGGKAGTSGSGEKFPSIRCVVLQSALSDVFCAGADLKERKGMSQAESEAFVSLLRDTFTALESLHIPTLSAVEGRALGGGLELALSTDIRVAGDKAQFGFPETGLAIIPGAGGTQRAPRLIGESKALELILTADPIQSSAALEIGLVNRVVPAGQALPEAVKIAARIARNGPIAVIAAKAAVRNGWGMRIPEAMEEEKKQYHVVLPTQDRLEGLKAFAEKRPPSYQGH